MIEFKKTTDFSRGTLYNQLVDAYSFFSGKYIDYEIDLTTDKTEQ